MLELTKKILRNVSFDQKLFRKELIKSLRWIREGEELQNFKNWCNQEFGSIYPTILNEVFLGYSVVK
ncbi:MAG: hypothetical protein RLZ10_650 [Bacteroidota bacterium]|jgi:hypothetical protein